MQALTATERTQMWTHIAVAGAGAFVGDLSVFVEGLLLARMHWVYTAGDSAIVVDFSAPAGCTFSVLGVWRIGNG